MGVMWMSSERELDDMFLSDLSGGGIYRDLVCVFRFSYFDSDTYPVPIEQARWHLFHGKFKSHSD
jgi:hypothetical protein